MLLWMARGGGKNEKQQRGHQGQRRRRKGLGEEVLQELKHISTALRRIHTREEWCRRPAAQGGPHAGPGEKG